MIEPSIQVSGLWQARTGRPLAKLHGAPGCRPPQPPGVPGACAPGQLPQVKKVA